jgi:predicted MFS family arabinose efflux permease
LGNKVSKPETPVPTSTYRLTMASVLILAAGFFTLFINGSGRLAVGLTLRPMVEDMKWTRADIGSAVALFQVASAVAMFFVGTLADRMSLRLLIGGGIAISALGIGLMGYVTEPWHVLVLFGLIYGIGNGGCSTITVGVMVSRAFPGRTGFANGFVTSGMSLGQLLMVALLAAVLVQIGWRSVYFWVAAAHVVLLPFIFFAVPRMPAAGSAAATVVREGMTIREAMRTRRFWMLLGIFAVCGLDDFFVTTHLVAFAQDSGVDQLFAGNLLALMGLAALVGVLLAGAYGDRTGPAWPTAVSFILRIACFGLVLVENSRASIAIFTLVFGLTFLVTAPLTVLFVREAFGIKNLGGISGLITMVHHSFGGLGAYIGARIFDSSGSYAIAFSIMLASSVLALVLTLMYRGKPTVAA